MNDGRKSESPLVPGNRGNSPERTPGREGGSSNTDPSGGKTLGTPRPGGVSSKLRRIADIASYDPQRVLTNLAHHIDLEFLRVAYDRTRKDGAAGVDRMTAEEYEDGLTDRLKSLLDRFKTGTYRAPPVRRVHIPKGDGKKKRPIGIPTLEDKILQRAVTMILEAVFEQNFLDCSHGFRPGRSAHGAIGALRKGLTTLRGGWVLEVDIKGFFDALDHDQLRALLDLRVQDGVLRRTIHKWLKAGIEEAGTLSYPERGTPQGGVISPILANIYLHYVLDLWFETQVRPGLAGRAFLVRYADDFVIAFECEADARKVYGMLPERLGSYGLEIHPEKTRLVPFESPQKPRKGEGESKPGKPGTFDFLGFTLYWGQAHGASYWVVKTQTAGNRLDRCLRKLREWCRGHRHDPIGAQQKTLTRKLRGLRNYYGLRGNSRFLSDLWYEVRVMWRKWLNRRSQRARMTWEKFKKLLERYPLPTLSTYIPRALRLAANPCS